MSEETRRQYSPDGKWWWDGAQWQPVVPATGGGHKAGPRRGLPGPLLVALVAIAALVVGAVAGAGIGAATSQRPTSRALPKVPSGFPNVSQNVLPGVTVPIVRGWMEKAQKYPWPCQPDANLHPHSGAKQLLSCDAPNQYPADAYTILEFNDDTHVWLVKGNCHAYPSASKDWCSTYFGNLADALFVKQSSLRQQAMDWAKQNGDSDSSTDIGGIHLEITLSPKEITAKASA